MRNFLNNHRFTECWTETCPNPCLCVTRHSASKCRTIQHFAGLLASQVTRTRTYIFLLARRSLICPTTHSFLNLRIRTPPFTLFSCLFISVTKPKTHAHQLNSLTTETVEKKWGKYTWTKILKVSTTHFFLLLLLFSERTYPATRSHSHGLPFGKEVGIVYRWSRG